MVICFFDFILMFIFFHSNTRNQNVTWFHRYRQINNDLCYIFVSFSRWQIVRSNVKDNLIWIFLGTDFTWSSRHLIVAPWNGLTKTSQFSNFPEISIIYVLYDTVPCNEYVLFFWLCLSVLLSLIFFSTELTTIFCICFLTVLFVFRYFFVLKINFLINFFYFFW